MSKHMTNVDTTPNSIYLFVGMKPLRKPVVVRWWKLVLGENPVIIWLIWAMTSVNASAQYWYGTTVRYIGILRYHHSEL